MSESGPGSSEEEQVAVRRAKAVAHGQPFPNQTSDVPRLLAAELRRRAAPARAPGADERYDAAAVAALGLGRHALLGRVVARRGFGKAVFLRLRDATGEVQLFARADAMGDGFAALDQLDLGDHVEALGTPMATRAGELSLEVDALRLMGKALRPLPDKWHGLADVDLRYRRRYVDFIATEEARAVLRARTLIVQGLRGWLDQRGFLEVETPTLHTVIGGAAARPFHTHHNALELPLFLRIAPELYLKRLLVGGFERVYEIGRCYRNEGLSTRHNPEFTMLEFYQAWATYEVLMAETEVLLRAVDQHLAAGMAAAGLGATYQRWAAARPFTLDEPFVRLPLGEAVAGGVARAGLPADLPARWAELAVIPGPEGEAPAALAARRAGDDLTRHLAALGGRAAAIDWGNLRRALGMAGTPGERTFVAYEYLVEPFLVEDHRSADGAKSRPVFVVDYPFETSPLARKKDADPTLVDRFELFVHGRELCNAFSELNDPDDQRRRFEDQVAKKARGAEETMDHDEDYVRALEHGMPPAAGFGMGVDRLVMMLTHQDAIRDVIAFPLLRPEASGAPVGGAGQG